jgi:glycolate oxidase subunit GlcD
MSAATLSPGLAADLAALTAADAVLDPGHHPEYGHDATAYRGLRGEPDAIVLPGSAAEVAAVLAYCYEHGLAVVPRGGGTGLAGGAVPVEGGVVVASDRLRAVRSFAPERWTIEVEAGVPTADVQRLARENGLLFAPDPGAAEQSHIGGNVATNAGGPHAFKYGVTGRAVTGVEAAMAPGELARFGGALAKDVAGYDIAHLLVGSEGTLGIVTSVSLRLLPAPAASLPLVAFFAEAAAGCEAVAAVVGSGLQVAALEYLDGATLAAVAGAYPGALPDDAGFLLAIEVDGDEEEARRLAAEVVAALGDEPLAVHAPQGRSEREALWRWRDGVSGAVAGQLGGKVSEDVAVPIDRLLEIVEGTLAIGERHGLRACSWGHAGDGNVHSSFLVDPRDEAQLERAEEAADELFGLAVALGGTISGEHGTGWLKRGQLGRQWDPAALAAQRAVKRALDPKGLLNPGKKGDPTGPSATPNPNEQER